MAKNKTDFPEGPSPTLEPAHLADSLARSAEDGSASVPMVTVLYSRHRDVYKLPAMSLEMWLSVEVHSAQFGVPEGMAATADRTGWRHVYTTWVGSMPAGDSAAIPANDPLALDYALAANSLCHPERSEGSTRSDS